MAGNDPTLRKQHRHPRPPEGQPPPAAPLARAFIVGRLERGPVNVPVIIADYEDFKARFGAGSATNSTAELSDMAADYFRTVGNLSDAVTLRLYEGDAAAATAQEAAGTDQVRAQAPGPGTYGNNLQRAFVVNGVGANQTLTVYAREVVNGIVVANRSTPAVPVTDEGIATANEYLAGVLALTYDALAVGAVAASSTAGGAPLVWVTLAGGLDSAALTAATLGGSVNDDTQVRTGLETLRPSTFGGGALIAPGFESAEGRAVKYAWAASTFRIVPEAPATDLLISGAVADYEAARTVGGAEFSAYYYPRARAIRAGRPVSRSPLGALAGLMVAAVMRRPGYIAPPAGETVLTDIQRSPDGRVALVTDSNMAALQARGLNVLVARTRIEAQGLALTIPDPLQPATRKLHHRLTVNTLAYVLGPVLAQFNNAYVDAVGAFYTAVEGELKKKIKPFHDSGVLFGRSLADAVDISFGFDQSPDELLERTGRVKVNIRFKVSDVAEGIDLSLGQVSVNTTF